LPFAKRIADTFTSHGGKILYNTKADKVVVKKGKVTGIVIGDKIMTADVVIITSDTMSVEALFDVPLNSPWFDRMREVTKPTSATFISLGINADLKYYPERPLIKLKNPITIDDITFESLLLSNYASDPYYSPENKSVITAQLPGDTYDYWKKLKDESKEKYAEEKKRVGDAVIAEIALYMPETKGETEVCDVATPLTYERYCGNWKGSWMSAITPEMKFKPYPAKIKKLDGVYFAGQRMSPPGGIPPAMMSGRTAVQHLCRDLNTIFVSE